MNLGKFHHNLCSLTSGKRISLTFPHLFPASGGKSCPLGRNGTRGYIHAGFPTPRDPALPEETGQAAFRDKRRPIIPAQPAFPPFLEPHFLLGKNPQSSHRCDTPPDTKKGHKFPQFLPRGVKIPAGFLPKISIQHKGQTTHHNWFRPLQCKTSQKNPLTAQDYTHRGHRQLQIDRRPSCLSQKEEFATDLISV